MTSISIAFTELTCDRCGELKQVHDGTGTVGWAHLKGQMKTGNYILAMEGYEMDLCPGCLEAFSKWIETCRSMRSAQG